MSFKEAVEPILVRLPAVASPEGHVHLKKKLLWTVGVLVLYLALSNVPLFGMSPESTDMFAMYRAFLAGQGGTLMLLGIGPIVTGSIILQLLVGAKVINLDLSDPRDQAIFQGTQKMLVFTMIIFTALPQVMGGYIEPSATVASDLGVSLNAIVLLLLVQICIGGALILFMDEIISKWGIGSGVGLFIVAGVSQQIFTGLFNWKLETGLGLPVGLIPRWVYMVQTGFGLPTGFINILLVTGLLALVSTVVIFLMVVFVESTRIEIPLAHSAVRGARGRFPVKLIYASVLPMILVRALQANLQMIGIMLSNHGITILGEFGGETGTTPLGGLMYYIAPIHSPYDWIPSLVVTEYASMGITLEVWQIVLHVLCDAVMLIGGGIIFALFWIETTGMGAKSVAQNIHRSGMQIPGFRRSPQSIERVMERYVPKVTIIGGAFIGALTLFASLLGTVGQAGGTGLLLTVSIVYRLYEDLASEQLMEMHPMMRSFFGGT
ncbi:MAG TPA: preprotein translocase subunit SecY [Methanosarcinales archaeon]|nr:preprotein translocase subunit SecY [Methanosarcinales archaeon]